MNANLMAGARDEMPTLPTLPDEGAMPMQAGEICVPLAALAQPDDQEALQTPGDGDTVSLQLDGTVRVVGDKAYVTPTAVNGQALQDEENNEGDVPSPDEAEGQALRQVAMVAGV